MATVFASLLAGLVFGLGLIVSGMADPAKVLGFLDLAGALGSVARLRDGRRRRGRRLSPSRCAQARTMSLLGAAMQLPTARDIDRRLVVGSLLFGVGWGVAGFCPGPALVALGMGEVKALVFVAGHAGGDGHLRADRATQAEVVAACSLNRR